MAVKNSCHYDIYISSVGDSSCGPSADCKVEKRHRLQHFPILITLIFGKHRGALKAVERAVPGCAGGEMMYRKAISSMAYVDSEIITKL
jgi:hypothetical protein